MTRKFGLSIFHPGGLNKSLNNVFIGPCMIIGSNIDTITHTHNNALYPLLIINTLNKLLINSSRPHMTSTATPNPTIIIPKPIT